MSLTGCDEAENVSVYNTIPDCERSAAKEQCALDYQNALAQNAKVAPPPSCSSQYPSTIHVPRYSISTMH